MKKEKDSNLDDTALSFENLQAKSCSAGATATFVCCSNICDRIAYVCDSKSCKCKEAHKNCTLILIQSIMNSLKAKIIPFDHYQNTILKKIDDTIEELSNLKDKIETFIKQRFSLYGLTVKDKYLYQALNEQNVTGKHIGKLFVQTMNENNKFGQKEAINCKFTELWKSIDTLIQTQSTNLLKLLEETAVKDETALLDLKLFDGTKITMSEKDKQNLIKFFSTKKVKSAKLIYRASQNNFQVNKFHQKCDNIPHTLTLCETVHNKVIGGYTPLLWNDQNGSYLKDESGESFIFSLTNNDKFTLDKSKDAIYPNKGHGPIFGNGNPDFCLANNSNNSVSSAILGQSYSNPNYTTGNGDSYMKFTGNPDKSQYYKAKEWQVWQLEF